MFVGTRSLPDCLCSLYFEALAAVPLLTGPWEFCQFEALMQHEGGKEGLKPHWTSAEVVEPAGTGICSGTPVVRAPDMIGVTEIHGGLSLGYAVICFLFWPEYESNFPLLSFQRFWTQFPISHHPLLGLPSMGIYLFWLKLDWYTEGDFLKYFWKSPSNKSQNLTKTAYKENYKLVSLILYQ